MKTQYYTAASLDGFIATEGDSLEWLFALGDVAETSYPEFIQGVGAIAMGAGTYGWLLRHFAETGVAPETAWAYTQPVWVLTHRVLPGIPGRDVRFAQGDVRPIHAAMREAAGGKNLWLAGGGELVGQFYDAGLLDEIHVQIGSATLGAGKPLLPRRITGAGALRLKSVRQIGQKFVELCYEVPPPA